MTLRWRRDAPLRGLSRIGAGPRGSSLYEGTKKYASVAAKSRYYKGEGWYWVAGWDSDVPHKNTCDAPDPDEATAKAGAMAYVKQHLKKHLSGN
jgi:hypothetical protein